MSGPHAPSTCPDATPGSYHLSETEKAFFARHGWIGVFPLLSKEGCRHLVQLHESVAAQFGSGEARDPKPWAKSLHAYVPEFFDVASHPALVDRVESILGPNVLAWGASITVRTPGQAHRWHVDVEHRRWRGITAFIGLSGTNPASGLKLISGSQRISEMPQSMGIKDDAAAEAAARGFARSTHLIAPPMREGEFLLFDGPLWHGSKNDTQITRYGLLIQYTIPSERVQIPLNCDEPLRWGESGPPCVLVRGRDDFRVNPLVERPTPDYVD